MYSGSKTRFELVRHRRQKRTRGMENHVGARLAEDIIRICRYDHASFLREIYKFGQIAACLLGIHVNGANKMKRGGFF